MNAVLCIKVMTSALLCCQITEHYLCCGFKLIKMLNLPPEEQAGVEAVPIRDVTLL